MTELAAITDPLSERAESVARQWGGRVLEDWPQVVRDAEIDAVVVSTPNALTSRIAIAALEEGKHVLIEKPPGCSLTEATEIARAARRCGRILKVGFNHRYHPALRRAHQSVAAGAIGELINVRARYGHGGRPGYEKEWRGNPKMAGGGELTDQGVHIADLINWFCGAPSSGVAVLQTAVWPIEPLEDNCFALLRFGGPPVASMHTSWTEWRNLFSFELFGRNGFIHVEGLGGSYGTETLTVGIRRPEGGPPELSKESFEGPDTSWSLEWEDFVNAITKGEAYMGTPEDGVAAMAVLDALYRSSKSGCWESLAR